MTIAERIALEANELSTPLQQQILDFVQFLKMKEQRQLEADMDAIIEENLPAWKELAK